LSSLRCCNGALDGRLGCLAAFVRPTPSWTALSVVNVFYSHLISSMYVYPLEHPSSSNLGFWSDKEDSSTTGRAPGIAAPELEVPLESGGISSEKPSANDRSLIIPSLK